MLPPNGVIGSKYQAADNQLKHISVWFQVILNNFGFWLIAPNQCCTKLPKTYFFMIFKGFWATLFFWPHCHQISVQKFLIFDKDFFLPKWRILGTKIYLKEKLTKMANKVWARYAKYNMQNIITWSGVKRHNAGKHSCC